MSGRIALALLIILAITALTTASLAASSPLSLAQQLAKSRTANRTLRLANADLRGQVVAQSATISDQTDQIARLQARIANQPAPLDAVLNGSSDDLWAAMTAIWRVMPTLDPGALCGYDRSSVPAGDGPGLTVTSYTFYRWSGC